MCLNWLVYFLDMLEPKACCLCASSPLGEWWNLREVGYVPPGLLVECCNLEEIGYESSGPLGECRDLGELGNASLGPLGEWLEDL